MKDKLEQLNVQYFKSEDRILLRTSTSRSEEYFIWLTRRFTRSLLNTLDQEIEKRGGTVSLAGRKETKALYEKKAFKQTNVQQKEKESIQKLDEQREIILACNINTNTDTNNNLILEFRSEDKGVVYYLNDTLLYVLYTLIHQGIQYTDWQLGNISHPHRELSDKLH